MTYIEAALRRALLRTVKRTDITDRAAVPMLLRELFEEGIYLKEVQRVKAAKK